MNLYIHFNQFVLLIIPYTMFLQTTVTVGDIICFSMPLLSSDGDPGYWQSSASEILLVDPIIGIGRTRNVGHASVRHSLATHMQNEIEVDVLPITRVITYINYVFYTIL